jgi:hypothetical protein
MRDAELRERFDEWAAPLRAATPPAFGSIRRRSRARMARFAAATGSAAAVVALAIVLALTGVVGGPQQPNPWGSGRYPAPPSQPYVYVSFSLGPTAQIRDAATGATLATLRPAGNQAIFGVAAASASDRLFVVAENPAGGTVTFAAIRIVAAGGRAPSVRMTQVPHVVLQRGAQITDLVVNPAGTRFALETQSLDGDVSLSIYNLLSGSLIGRWAAAASQLTSPLAFLPGGNLAVVWQENGPIVSQSKVGPPHGSGGARPHRSTSTTSPGTSDSTSPAASLTYGASSGPSRVPVLVNRIINPSVPFRAGSSINADSQPDTALHRRIGTMTPDANLNLSAAEAPAPTTETTPGSWAASQPSGMASVAESSTATGALVRWIPLGPASALTPSSYCGVLWTSPDGSDLLTQCGTTQQEVVNGKVTAVRLAWTFPTSSVQSVSPFAW